MSARTRLAEATLFYALLLYAGLLLFSVSYGSIFPGLDPSWAFALNHFAHGPEIFGRDIIFTYGPLGYLAAPEHVGKNLQIAVAAHIAAWCILLYLLVELRESGQKVGAFFCTMGLILSNKLYADYWDYLLSAILLVAFLLLLKRPGRPSILVILALAIGVLFLVKFTGYILGTVLLALYIASRILSGSRPGRKESGLLLLAVFSGPLAYLAYNPSIFTLAGYVRGSLNIASGYSTAMSLPTEASLGWHAAVTGSALIACVAVCLVKKWVPLAGAAMVLATDWVAFKHGFVRSGPSHSALFFCFGILVLAFLLAQVSFTKQRAAVLVPVFAAFSIFSLQAATVQWQVWSTPWWSPHRTLNQVAQLMSWDHAMAELDQISNYVFRPSVINNYTYALSKSRVLFFPWNVSYGSRGQITTVPLFATQAYSAYTAFLDQQSARNIEASSPPLDYIFFEWMGIDARNPLVDVPATWNALFSGFIPDSPEPEVFILKRRPSPLRTAFIKAENKPCPAETWIDVPRANTPVALSLSLKPTLLGRVLTILYQLGAVNLEVQTRAGVASSIRIPPEVVSYPFPINYLPFTSASLNALWRDNLVTDPIVRFRLTGPGISSLHCDGAQFYNLTGTSVRVM